MSTDFRALCAELLAEVEALNDVIGQEGQADLTLLPRARTALAANPDPAPVAEGGPHLEIRRHFSGDRWLHMKTPDRKQAAINMGQPTYQTGVSFFDVVIDQMAELGAARYSTPTPASVPVAEPSNDVVELAAAIIFEQAMMPAAATPLPNAYGGLSWVSRGNSTMQDKARSAARAVLARYSTPAEPTTPPIS